MANLKTASRISTVLKRDVEAWITLLSDDLALSPATVNSHLASLSKFCSWVDARRHDLLACVNPSSGVRELPLPALEPRALSPAQQVGLRPAPALSRAQGQAL